MAFGKSCDRKLQSESAPSRRSKRETLKERPKPKSDLKERELKCDWKESLQLDSNNWNHSQNLCKVMLKSDPRK